MYRFEVVPRIASLRSNAPEKKVTDSLRRLRVRLFGRDNGVFVVDKRIGIRPRSVHQGKTLIGRRAWGQRGRGSGHRSRRWQQKLAILVFKQCGLETTLVRIGLEAPSQIAHGIGCTGEG